MRKIKFPAFYLVIVIAVLFLPACSDSPEPVTNGVVNLTFTGDDCVSEAPEYLKAGPVTINFVNDGDMNAAINTVRHLEDKSHQDMLDYMGGGEGAVFGHAPDWTEELGTFHWIKPGEEYQWVGDLDPGLYTIANQRISGSIWYCVGLTVVE